MQFKLQFSGEMFKYQSVHINFTSIKLDIYEYKAVSDMIG